MRKQFYLDITARLKQIIDDEDNQIFKHFDLWNSQLDEDYQGAPIKYPCIFLEFLPIPWESLGKNRQAANLQFKLHIPMQTLAKTADNSHNIDKALQQLDLIDAVHYWLTRFTNDYIGTVVRIASTHDHYHAGIADHVETYKCRVIDDSAVLPFVSVPDETKLVVSI